MNKSRIALIISFLLLFVSIGVFFLVGKKIQHYGDLSKIIDYSKVNFAGEKVSFEGKYYYNLEKFERELSVTRFNMYQFVLYHKREPLYIPYIEKKLKEAGIPDDFKYLAIAESGLRNDSLSSAGAGGIWQFVPDTAKQYKLQITDSVDERYNFELETDAAIKYFQKLYDDFHDWTLVAAAYNRGENGLRRAIDDQKVQSYYDLYLNEETTRYLFRIIAIKYLMENRYKVFDRDELGDVFSEPKTRFVNVSELTDIKAWCQQEKYDYATVRQLNQWILGNSLPKGDWKVKVLDL
ncbi:MAG: lytic transglycosylase domain-containing protein [Candidatus Gracilibacteria bacterium]|nr:lytic transglycosylase domain-containing protein [Candidatus Gracilibacteria bacterium]